MCETTPRKLDELGHASSLTLLLSSSNLNREALRKCADYAHRGIGVGGTQGSLMLNFIYFDGWDRFPEVCDLFGLYVKLGMVDVDDGVRPPFERLSSFPNDSHPLEAAVLNGSLSAFRVLLANGSNDKLLPSRAILNRNAAAIIATVHDVIERYGGMNAAAFSAMLREHGMLKCIESEVREPSPQPQSQRRMVPL